MNKIQSILIAFCVIALFSCQGDNTVNSAKETMDKTKEVVKKVANDVNTETKKVMEASTKEPKLREFYVEEDKTKSEPKRSASEKGVKSDTKTSGEKVAAKPAKKSKSKKAPKMSFTNDSFAFGMIKPGDVIEHKFEFTNTGNADLVITDAKATCGCTQPSFPFVPIAPGEKGFIGVKYDSTGKLGTQKPTVTITTNAYPKTKKIYLEGIVLSEMSKN